MHKSTKHIILILAIGVLLLLNPAIYPIYARAQAGAGISSMDSPSLPFIEYPASSNQILIPPNSYYNQIVQAIGKNTTLVFNIQSTEPMDIYIMNQQQFAQFRLRGTIDSLYNYTGVLTLSTTATLATAGIYELLMVNYIQTFTSLIFSYSTIPVNIYLLYDSAPAPVGIVDYGVLNSSGVLTPYILMLSQVIGKAKIGAMQAYNSSFSSPYGASLQLNAVLQVNTTSGQYNYFLQNVAEFTTNYDNLYFADNVWNDSSASSLLSNSAIHGGGSVTNSIGYQPVLNHLISFYSYTTENISYKLPLDLLLPIAVSYSGKEVTVYFGYQIYNSSSVTYDRVTITEPSSVLNAAIIVDGLVRTPLENYYDVELVFGGENSGELTTFTSMNASLDLYYAMPNGTVTSPESLYTFGSDTAEAAYNLKTVLVNGTPSVVIGTPNFGASLTGITGKPPEINGFPAGIKMGGSYVEVIIVVLLVVALILAGIILIERKFSRNNKLENNERGQCPSEPANEENPDHSSS